MERRGFLKLLSAFAASAALPCPQFVLAEPEIILPAMPFELAKIRVIAAWELYENCHIVRTDMYNAKTKEQGGCDFYVRPRKSQTMREAYLAARKSVELILADVIQSRGWNVADMELLPIPPNLGPGVTADAPWMHA